MIDEDTRELLRTLDGPTLVVEAGAGTGKTATLVGRIVEMVARGRLTMERLAAITFTEPAAAELRDRIRSRLEQAGGDEPDAERRGRCRIEAARVDLAAIQTIHSFAAELLRSFPIEARLPPGFAILDEIWAQQQFDERFRTWLFDEVPDERFPERRNALRRAFALGMTPDQLRTLARSVHEHYDLLTPQTAWPGVDLPDVVAECRASAAELLALAEYVHLACDGEADALVQELRKAQLHAERMAAVTTVEQALVVLCDVEINRPKQTGSAKNWQGKEGEAAVREIKDAFKTVFGAGKTAGWLGETLSSYRTDTLSAVLTHLRDFTLTTAEERRRRGTATFHDLLTWARDLLRGHPEVRARAQTRFQQIFVDEFQDTDPLQAEIVTLLAAEPDADPSVWRSLPLRPGVLFLVGDPKQSIYRFRRADVRIYNDVYARAEQERPREYLVQSFRSSVPVLSYVNALFAELLREERYTEPGIEQARPVELEWDPARINAPDARVGRIGSRITLPAGDKWRMEAADVARLARQAVAEYWQVTEPGKDGVTCRDAHYGDICILMPTRTNLRLLERALEECGVPYRVASGTLVLDTQEVRDLLACLRSIDDPSDQVALVGALRSPAYACSDAQLYAWVHDGGELSYLGGEAAGPAHASVRDALHCLYRYHDRRPSVSPAALIEAFIHERWLAVQAYGQPRPREALRRLRYVVDRARAFAAGGQPSLRALLDWLDDRRRESAYDPESPMPEADERAVQLMTIHGAKGLEFPIVVLAGMGSRAAGHHEPAVAPARDGIGLEAHCSKFETPGWDKNFDGLLDDAEQVRLLYVAATRARDHLVISLYHAKGNCSGGPCHVERILEAVEHGVPELPEVALHDVEPDSNTEPNALPEEDDGISEADWTAQRTALIDRLAALPLRLPSDLHGSGPAPDFVPEPPLDPFPAPDLEPAEDDDEAIAAPAPTVRGSTKLGQAVHATLQLVDLDGLHDLEEVATAQAGRFGIPDQAGNVATLAGALAGSASVRAAVRSRRFRREVRLGASLHGVMLAGAIDLLWQREDGTLCVVDYKTDQIPDGEVAKRARYYSLQLGAYVLALQAMNLTVSRAELIFVTAAGARPVAYEGALLDEIVAAARAALTGAGVEPPAVAAG